MKKKPLSGRMVVSMLCLFLMLAGFAQPALAYDKIDLGQNASLTLYFGKSGNGFSNALFSLYRVADVSEHAHFTLTGDFEGYPVAVNDLDKSGWRALAQTLDGYVARDNLPPLHTGQTGADGKLTFSKLPPSLYLVVGQPYVSGRYTYTPEPLLICLPSLDAQGAWEYNETASIKYDADYDPPGGGGDDDDDTITRKVLKVWEDDGHRSKRPEEVVVQLLRDGRVFDTVTLSAKNHWRYTWNDLDDDYVWRVVEYDVPKGYTVSVEREGITFVMTNTRRTEEPDEPDIPDEPPEVEIPEEPTPGGDLTPSEEEPEPTPENDEVPTDDASDDPDTKEKLPQTGTLWWPVPLLAGSGLLLFLIGWCQYHKKEDMNGK